MQKQKQTQPLISREKKKRYTYPACLNSILVTHAYLWQQLWRSNLIKQYVIPLVSFLRPNQNTQNKSFVIWDENDKIWTYSLLTSQTDITCCAALFEYKQLWQNLYPDLLHTGHKFHYNELLNFFVLLFFFGLSLTAYLMPTVQECLENLKWIYCPIIF